MTNLPDFLDDFYNKHPSNLSKISKGFLSSVYYVHSFFDSKRRIRMNGGIVGDNNLLFKTGFYAGLAAMGSIYIGSCFADGADESYKFLIVTNAASLVYSIGMIVGSSREGKWKKIASGQSNLEKKKRGDVITYDFRQGLDEADNSSEELLKPESLEDKVQINLDKFETDIEYDLECDNVVDLFSSKDED